MPLVDMRLDQLEAYQGRNPRPEDFDAYWDKALADMHALGADCDLIPSGFQVPGIESFDLYFHGVNGSRVHARYARPAQTDNCAGLVHFHGYSGSCMDWPDLLSWVAAGFCIASMDCRGQGGESEDRSSVGGTTLRGHIIRGLNSDQPEDLYYRQVFLDTAQLSRIVAAQAEVDSQRIGAFGGSQGGALTLACASLDPNVKRAAPVYPFLCDYQRVWEMDLDKAAYDELSYFFRHFDPEHLQADYYFTRLGYIDCQHLAPRIQAEILMGTGLMDTVCPPSTQYAAYNKITSEKSVRIYPDFGHEGLPGFNRATMEFMLGMQEQS